MQDKSHEQMFSRTMLDTLDSGSCRVPVSGKASSGMVQYVSRERGVCPDSLLSLL